MQTVRQFEEYLHQLFCSAIKYAVNYSHTYIPQHSQEKGEQGPFLDTEWKTKEERPWKVGWLQTESNLFDYVILTENWNETPESTNPVVSSAPLYTLQNKDIHMP